MSKEDITTKEGLQKEIRKRILVAAASYLKNLEEDLPRSLARATASILGFEVDHFNHEWKVDHNGELATYIVEKAKKTAKDCIEKMITPEVILKALGDERRRREIIHDFEYKFRYAFDEQLKQIAETLGKQMAVKVAGELLGERIKLDEPPSRLSNPKVELDPLHAQILFDKLTGLFEKEAAIAASAATGTSAAGENDDGGATGHDTAGGATTPLPDPLELDIPEENVPF